MFICLRKTPKFGFCILMATLCRTFGIHVLTLGKSWGSPCRGLFKLLKIAAEKFKEPILGLHCLGFCPKDVGSKTFGARNAEIWEVLTRNLLKLWAFNNKNMRNLDFY